MEGVRGLNWVPTLRTMRIRMNGACFLSSWPRQDCLCYILLNSIKQCGETVLLFTQTSVSILKKKTKVETRPNPINPNCLPTECQRTSRKQWFQSMSCKIKLKCTHFQNSKDKGRMAAFTLKTPRTARNSGIPPDQGHSIWLCGPVLL